MYDNRDAPAITDSKQRAVHHVSYIYCTVLRLRDYPLKRFPPRENKFLQNAYNMAKVMLCRFGELVDSTTTASTAETNSVCVTVHLCGVTPFLPSTTTHKFNILSYCYYAIQSAKS